MREGRGGGEGGGGAWGGVGWGEVELGVSQCLGSL